MNDSVKNIMIVGVGGQGTLLASKMLGYVLMHQGYDVKVATPSFGNNSIIYCNTLFVE